MRRAWAGRRKGETGPRWEQLESRHVLNREFRSLLVTDSNCGGGARHAAAPGVEYCSFPLTCTSSEASSTLKQATPERVRVLPIDLSKPTTTMSAYTLYQLQARGDDSHKIHSPNDSHRIRQPRLGLQLAQCSHFGFGPSGEICALVSMSRDLTSM